MASGGRGDPQNQPQSGNKRRPAAVLGLEVALVSGAAASFPPAVPLELLFFIYPEQNSSQPQSSCFQIKCHLSLLSYLAAFFLNLPDFLPCPDERCVTLITMSMFKLVTIPREAKGSGEGIFGCV